MRKTFSIRHLIYEGLVLPFRLYVTLDGFFSSLTTRLIHRIFPPKHPVVGQCKKRGLCCENIGIQLSDGFWRFPYLTRLAIYWYSWVYHFHYKGAIVDDQVLLFSCRYLQNKRCQIYWRRPSLCRRYPEADFFRRRQFIPGCGFSLKE